MMYALLMDETNKALIKENKGITIPETKIRVPSLLWMDDLVLIEINEPKSQELLDITNDISLRYHIEYGEPKSNFIVSGRRKSAPTIKLGNINLKETDTYKYLGEMINKNLNLTNQIKQIEGKVEGAYQTILAIAGDRDVSLYYKTQCDMQCTFVL